MKKQKVTQIILYIIACIFACAVVVGVCLYTRMPRGSAKITGTVVDNDYNNFLTGGNLVRIDDKLYYNYYRNDFAHGLIEISESGSKRIYWAGWIFGGYGVLHRIRQHDGHLVMAYDDKIQAYSPDSGVFEVYCSLHSLPKMTLRYQTAGQKMVYRQVNDFIRELAVQENGETKVIAGPNVSSFYAAGDEIYYYDFNDNLRTKELRKYSLTDGTDVSVCKLDGYHNISSFMIEGDYLIFAAAIQNSDNYTETIYKIDLNSSSTKIEAVCAEDTVGDIRFFNIYDGKIYVTSDTGITAYDVATNKSSKLCDERTYSCYIVDDTWVYFENEENQLWRVAQTGGTAEKVFG